MYHLHCKHCAVLMTSCTPTICAGIGNWINGMELTMLASYPYTTNYIQVSSFNDLNAGLSQTLLDLVCDSKCVLTSPAYMACEQKNILAL